MSLSQDLQFAIELARGAGKIVLDHYGKVERLTKRHAEAVTDADRASQRFIVAGLKRRYPGDGIVGEENDTGSGITFDCPDPGGRVWVIDPIDGTNNFIAGLGVFGVCIGLMERGRLGELSFQRLDDWSRAIGSSLRHSAIAAPRPASRCPP